MHPVSACERRLQSLIYRHGDKKEFICACGRRWILVSEGPPTYRFRYVIGNPICETTRQNCSWPNCKCDGSSWFRDQERLDVS